MALSRFTFGGVVAALMLPFALFGGVCGGCGALRCALVLGLGGPVGVGPACFRGELALLAWVVTWFGLCGAVAVVWAVGGGAVAWRLRLVMPPVPVWLLVVRGRGLGVAVLLVTLVLRLGRGLGRSAAGRLALFMAKGPGGRDAVLGGGQKCGCGVLR